MSLRFERPPPPFSCEIASLSWIWVSFDFCVEFIFLGDMMCSFASFLLHDSYL